jgi:hypothetical protein
VRIERRRSPPRSTALAKGQLTLYEVELTAPPTPGWRAALLHPQSSLKTPKATPELVRLEVQGTRVLFRTVPPKLHYWLRWVDRWIEDANSVVKK